jgi:hypothetical protein
LGEGILHLQAWEVLRESGREINCKEMEAVEMKQVGFREIILS